MYATIFIILLFFDKIEANVTLDVIVYLLL